MSKHNDILKSFRNSIPSFDITAKDHKELVSCLLEFLLVIFYYFCTLKQKLLWIGSWKL